MNPINLSNTTFGISNKYNPPNISTAKDTANKFKIGGDWADNESDKTIKLNANNSNTNINNFMSNMRNNNNISTNNNTITEPKCDNINANNNSEPENNTKSKFNFINKKQANNSLMLSESDLNNKD